MEDSLSGRENVRSCSESRAIRQLQMADSINSSSECKSDFYRESSIIREGFGDVVCVLLPLPTIELQPIRVFLSRSPENRYGRLVFRWCFHAGNESIESFDSILSDEPINGFLNERQGFSLFWRHE